MFSLQPLPPNAMNATNIIPFHGFQESARAAFVNMIAATLSTTSPAPPAALAAPQPEALPYLERNEAITRIKAGLERRTGRKWSVTGGSGTAWGWIKVTAPPKRRTWGSKRRENPPPGCSHSEEWEPVDIGEPNRDMSPDDRECLKAALGVHWVGCSGESIPASGDYYREYVDRAEGIHPPRRIGKPYWD